MIQDFVIFLGMIGFFCFAWMFIRDFREGYDKWWHYVLTTIIILACFLMIFMLFGMWTYKH